MTRNQASPPFNQLPGIEGESYQAFLGTKAGILETVFVGSNNGILHAFNANTGEEIMGYIPEGILISFQFSLIQHMTMPSL